MPQKVTNGMPKLATTHVERLSHHATSVGADNGSMEDLTYGGATVTFNTSTPKAVDAAAASRLERLA